MAIYLDIIYVEMHSKNYELRKAKKIYILEWMKYMC